MKKIHTLILILVAVLAFQICVPAVGEKEVRAASTETQKKKGFYKEGKGKYCYYKDGKKLKEKWKKVNGNLYYFGKDGYAYTTNHKVKGIRYLFREDGRLYKKNPAAFVKVRNRIYHVDKKGIVKIGWFRVGKYVYYADSHGKLIQNSTYQGVKFNSKGQTKYTESLEVKMKVQNILKSITTSKMSKGQKLSACYNYLVRRGGFGYSTAYYPNLARSKWYVETADRMLSLRRGNCYGFACAFAAFAKELGYNPYLMCGRVPGSRDGASDGYTRHCWVMIDGRHYDPEGAYAGWGGCFGSAGFTTAYTLQRKVAFKY